MEKKSGFPSGNELWLDHTGWQQAPLGPAVLVALIVIKTFLVLSPMRARLRLNPFLVLRGTAEGDGLLRADESSKHPAQEAPPAPPSPRSS